jgi:hypothetical protein
MKTVAYDEIKVFPWKPHPLRPSESRDSSPTERKVVRCVCARDLFEEEPTSASRIVSSLR